MGEATGLGSGDDDPDATVPEQESDARRREVEAGETLGRYRVLGLVGTGGMGVVYRVYDPELDREIALKLLLIRSRSGGDASARRARMVREAQALARLSHPNVVTVFDVGTIEGDPYIAMEYIDGPTLKEWLGEPRAWRAVVEVFIAAGRGLEAAHAQGIVHRDFKLANVLVGRDGRPRVLDFGLARPATSAGSLSESAPSGPITMGGTGTLTAELTKAGVVMGTPKTMSPEQHSGSVADELSDQYSFCVALFEALFGIAPFAARRLHELAKVKQLGRTEPIPDTVKVPARIRKAVFTGLSPSPQSRFRSMNALLGELEAGSRPPLRWPWAVGVGLASVGIAALTVPSRDGRCRVDELRESVWNDTIRAQSAAAFEATGLAYAPASWTRAEQLIGEHVEAWTAAYEQTCAAETRATLDDAQLDRRIACIRSNARALGALATTFAAADAAVVEHAVQAAAELPKPARCTESRARDEVAPPPDAVVAHVERARSRLVEAAAFQATGKFPEAMAAAAEVVDAPVAASYPPLRAEAQLRLGLVCFSVAETERAQAALTDAYLVATEVGDDEVAFRAATALVTVVGVDRAQFDDGHQWARHAEALLSRQGSDARLEEAQLTSVAGVLLRAQGRFAEALQHHTDALQMREALLGDQHLDVAASLENAGQVLHDLGRMTEAIPKLERALKLRREVLGPEHPDVARSLSSLAYELYIIGDAETAIEAQSEALAIRRRVLAPDHPDIAESLSNLGRAYGLVGRIADALAVENEALTIRRKAFGDSHPAVATSLSSIGITLHNEGRFEEALDHQRRALAIREKVLGPQHPHVAMVLINMGFDLQNLERNDEALDAHRRAEVIVREAYGTDHLLITYALTGQGDALMAMARPAEAVTALERGVAIAEAHDQDFLALGQARFALARALWAAGKDRPRALATAAKARGEFERAGEPGRATVEAMDAWLTEIGATL
ncbi:MAG: serine/threonine-protein kinase [Myxococcota bacterium]